MSTNQASFPPRRLAIRLDPSMVKVARPSPISKHALHAGIADELCFVKSMYTEGMINHGPGVTMMQTWVCSFGADGFLAFLRPPARECQSRLPDFVVLIYPISLVANHSRHATGKWFSFPRKQMG
jgi:hypothetical protein